MYTGLEPPHLDLNDVDDEEELSRYGTCCVSLRWTLTKAGRP